MRKLQVMVIEGRDHLKVGDSYYDIDAIREATPSLQECSLEELHDEIKSWLVEHS